LLARAGVALPAFAAERNDGEPPEAARIDEANLAFVGQREHGVRVRREWDIRLRDEQSPCHPKVHKELRGWLLRAREIEDDRLADAAHALDGRAAQRLGDLFLRRLEGLRFAAGPHTGDALPADARVDAIGDGFDFWEFRHGDWMRSACDWPRGDKKGSPGGWRRRPFQRS